IALVLAVIGVLGIILGIVYLAVPAGSLPSILGHTTPANGHHVVRMTVSFVLGAAFLVGAWFVSRRGKASATASTPAPAQAAAARGAPAPPAVARAPCPPASRPGPGPAPWPARGAPPRRDRLLPETIPWHAVPGDRAVGGRPDRRPGTCRGPGFGPRSGGAAR